MPDVSVDDLWRQIAAVMRFGRELGKARVGNDWDPIALANLLQEASSQLELPAELRWAAAALYAGVANQAAVKLLELKSTLDEICSSRRWTLDGQWPEFVVERGLDVQVDEERRRVRVGDVLATNLAAQTLERLIESGVKALTPPGFQARRFMEGFATAYDAVSPSGGQVSVWAVYRELVLMQQRGAFWRDAAGKRFVELTGPQFRARLSRSLEAGVTAAADGRELRLLPPLDPKEGLFLFQPAEGRFGFVGRVEFVAPGGES